MAIGVTGVPDAVQREALLRRAGTYGWSGAVWIGPRTSSALLHAAQRPGHIHRPLPLLALLGRNRGRPAFGADNTDLIAVDHPIRRGVDDTVFQRNAPGQFDFAPEVARNRHLLE